MVPPYLEKNLLRRGGHATTRAFLNPCLKFKIVTKEEFSSREPIEHKKFHEQSLQKENPEFTSSHPYLLEEEIKEP